METAGDNLDKLQGQIMDQRRAGLTTVYNLVNNEGSQDNDIKLLRDAHISVDEAVRTAYSLDEKRDPGDKEYQIKETAGPLPSWESIELGHGFYDTPQGPRFMISPQARIDILDKLLALNYYRHNQEIKQGLHSRKGRNATQKGARHTVPNTAAGFADSGLFKPDGTLF